MGKNVLVVDDDMPIRQLLDGLLRHLGHTPHTVSSGADALRKIETTPFDLFLVDYNMPIMRGDELAREIKRQRPTAPVVLITGSPPQDVPDYIDRVMRKPFSLAELAEVLSAFL